MMQEQKNGPSSRPQGGLSIFISPHIDDVVFSCGGTLARLCREGRVLVIYVFSDYGKDTDQRKREEEANAKRIGYDYAFLDFKDLYQRSWLGFFPFRRNRLMEEKSDVECFRKICGELQIRIQKIEYDRIYFPLGIGFHIDHEICFHAGMKQPDKGKVFFYEDLPYALNPGFLEEKIYYLRGEGVKIRGRNPVDDPLREMNSLIRYVASRPAYAKIPSKALRGTVTYFLRRYFEGRFKRRRRLRPPYSFVDLTPHFVCINNTFDLKIQGMWAYESQMPLFFRSQEEMRESLYRYHWVSDNTETGLYERFWEIKPAL